MHLRMCFTLFAVALGSLVSAADPVPLPAGFQLEAEPTDPQAKKIVFIAGSNTFKPGEHEYIGGCAVLMDLVKQTPGVFPVLALDWPTKPKTLANAAAIVLLLDGGDKHAFLKGDRFKEILNLAKNGVGIVQLHQVADYPKDFGERARELAGGAWEKGLSQRAHWIEEFKEFPDHPIFRGVTSFKIDDGWLWKMRFVEGMKGVSPLLRTVNPKSKDDPKADAAIISWAFERTGGGRSFTFTGGHLHSSFKEEGYRRFLTNGILWSAGIEVPKTGAPVTLQAENLAKYLPNKPEKK